MNFNLNLVSYKVKRITKKMFWEKNIYIYQNGQNKISKKIYDRWDFVIQPNDGNDILKLYMKTEHGYKVAIFTFERKDYVMVCNFRSEVIKLVKKGLDPLIALSFIKL